MFILLPVNINILIIWCPLYDTMAYVQYVVSLSFYFWLVFVQKEVFLHFTLNFRETIKVKSRYREAHMKGNPSTVSSVPYP